MMVDIAAMVLLILLGIYYLNREEMENIEISNTMQKTKQRLRELAKIVSPEMHAFMNLYFPRASVDSIKSIIK